VISSTLSILFRSCHWKQPLFICVRRPIKYSGNVANADPERYVLLAAVSHAAPDGARDVFGCARFYKHFIPNGVRMP
jgi:hypothetical protein